MGNPTAFSPIALGGGGPVAQRLGPLALHHSYGPLRRAEAVPFRHPRRAAASRSAGTDAPRQFWLNGILPRCGRVRKRLAIFLVIVQSLLLLVHGFVYLTWVDFWGGPDPPADSRLAAGAVVLLAVSFVAASLAALRSSHWLVRLFYTVSSAWAGTVSFCFLAACCCWVVYAPLALGGIAANRRMLAELLFGLALAASLYGVANAAIPRVRSINIKLANLPESWRGRVAALVSDTHLGPVRNRRFAERIVRKLNAARPDIVFLGGDMYDGTAADLDGLAAPWGRLAAPHGTYFVTGNHEEFTGRGKYVDAMACAGVRVLNNEKLVLDGMQIVGVHYRDSADIQRFRSILRRAVIEPGRPSILLSHAPHRLRIAEEEGISLQLSGHTHGGQIFPFTWMTRRIYGRYTYGLQRLGNMTTYTSSGAGTWGPPLRVGTKPEIVLIRFGSPGHE
jgi:uncharacterized protein